MKFHENYNKLGGLADKRAALTIYMDAARSALAAARGEPEVAR